MKTCSRNGNITQYMDMPCQCDCGRFYDLHDGYAKKFSRNTVCATCHEIEELEEQIEEIQDQITAKDIGKRVGNKQIEELRNEMERIYEDDENY